MSEDANLRRLVTKVDDFTREGARVISSPNRTRDMIIAELRKANDLIADFWVCETDEATRDRLTILTGAAANSMQRSGSTEQLESYLGEIVRIMCKYTGKIPAKA